MNIKIHFKLYTCNDMHLLTYFPEGVKKILNPTKKNVQDNCQQVDPIYPTPPLGQDMTQGQFLSGV